VNRDEKSASPALTEVQDVLDLLLRVFLAGSAVSRDLLRCVISSAVRESMEDLGLLCADPADPERYFSPVALCPVQGLYMASDWWTNPAGSPFPVVKDYVFPAIHPRTHGFLDLLAPSPCDRFLELCSGTAIAAPLASSVPNHQFASMLRGLISMGILKIELL
jgi:hypothetical protein